MSSVFARIHARRGELTGINANADGRAMLVRVNVDGFDRDDIEAVEEYGLATRPRKGAEVLLAAIEGQTGHQVVIRFADRRYRLAVSEGEVCLYDDQGQRVHLKRDGIEVSPKNGGFVKVNGKDLRFGDGAAEHPAAWEQLKKIHAADNAVLNVINALMLGLKTTLDGLAAGAGTALLSAANYDPERVAADLAQAKASIESDGPASQVLTMARTK